MNAVIPSLTLPFSQLADRAFLSPLAKGILGAVLAYAGLLWLADWGVSALLAGEGWWSALARLFGALLVLASSIWLFVPVAIALAGIFLDEVAEAVERRFYPGLPPADGASLLGQGWAGLVLGLKVLALTVVVLPLVLLMPPFGMVLLWVIGAVALGYGFFEAVAQRRMSVAESRVLRRRWRWQVLGVGAGLSILASVPGANLLIPVLGTAAMTHLLNRLPQERAPLLTPRPRVPAGPLLR